MSVIFHYRSPGLLTRQELLIALALLSSVFIAVEIEKLLIGRGII